ncbi:MAG: tRNA 2-thiouridine(34) synthase MnmA [Clostridia bacterium]|nr:tRNA 2-thiouridine(34) synthase MnmA [Clostridia bacterium]
MDLNKVAIAMSGGVDSSVAAYILKKRGYEVIGITMELFSDNSAVQDAKMVADQLGIEHHVVDLKKVFDQKVVDYFGREYFAGRTPNPCVTCNRYIKFGELLTQAKRLGAFYLATGHYARVEFDSINDRFLLKKAENIEKDQSYVLYNLKQRQLKHILLPLGYYSKAEIRGIAEELGISVAEKPESQEICFIKDNDYAGFIKRNFPDKIESGTFMDTKGNVLGTHKGIIHYTIGQRKGLGIALGKPMYVVDIDHEKNLVILGEADEVFSQELIVNDINFVFWENFDGEAEAQVKIRYNAQPAPATLCSIDEDKILVKFKQPERAITPGQSAVFYDGDVVLGGGIILKNT